MPSLAIPAAVTVSPAALLSLDPLTQLVATALATAHRLLSEAGFDPAAGATWLAALALLVAGVRVALLPFVIHAVRSARARGRAAPALADLARRQQSLARADLESFRRLTRERARILAGHGVSRLAWLWPLAQLPVLLALYRVLASVADHTPVGAITPDLVAVADHASLAGVTLADRWIPLLTAAPTQGLTVTAVVLATATLNYLTQKWFVLPNTTPAVPLPTTDRTGGALEGRSTEVSNALTSVARFLPTLSALGVVGGAAVVPVGVVVYWALTNVWTMCQQAVVFRWFPTPGTAAGRSRSERLRSRRGFT